MTDHSARALLDGAHNRSRFRTEGVQILVGDTTRRYPLPIESIREIYVRPAYRMDDARTDRVDALVDGAFEALHKPMVLLGIGAIAAVTLDLLFAVLR